MVISILQHTPVWVWALLSALVALGLVQTQTRQMTLGRAALLPVIMVTLSVAGVASRFGVHALPLLAWAGGAAAAIATAHSLRVWRGIGWSASTSRFQVPGSWLPLALILVLFVVKYTVAVNLVMNPELQNDPVFPSAASLAYGFFSGLFLARALTLWSAIRQPANMQLA